MSWTRGKHHPRAFRCLFFSPLIDKTSPELIERLSRRFNVAKNYMFIGTPSDRFSYRIRDLGRVRLII